MYEREVPNVSANVANPVRTELGANGALCASGQRLCTAPEYAVVNYYINRQVNPHLTVGFRSDFLDDQKGQRPGVATKYTEDSLYATKYFGSTVMLRPEIRFDHPWDKPGYNNGTARNQFSAGADLIYKF